MKTTSTPLPSDLSDDDLIDAALNEYMNDVYWHGQSGGPYELALRSRLANRAMEERLRIANSLETGAFDCGHAVACNCPTVPGRIRSL